MKVGDLRAIIEGMPDDADVYIMSDDAQMETPTIAADCDGDMVAELREVIEVFEAAHPEAAFNVDPGRGEVSEAERNEEWLENLAGSASGAPRCGCQTAGHCPLIVPATAGARAARCDSRAICIGHPT